MVVHACRVLAKIQRMLSPFATWHVILYFIWWVCLQLCFGFRPAVCRLWDGAVDVEPDSAAADRLYAARGSGHGQTHKVRSHICKHVSDQVYLTLNWKTHQVRLQAHTHASGVLKLKWTNISVSLAFNWLSCLIFFAVFNNY